MLRNYLYQCSFIDRILFFVVNQSINRGIYYGANCTVHSTLPTVGTPLGKIPYRPLLILSLSWQNLSLILLSHELWGHLDHHLLGFSLVFNLLHLRLSLPEITLWAGLINSLLQYQPHFLIRVLGRWLVCGVQRLVVLMHFPGSVQSAGGCGGGQMRLKRR